MFNFKKYFVGLLGITLLVCALATLLPLTGRGQGNNTGGPPQLGQRKFYLTQTQHNGSGALTACAGGYHMASLWEIFDPSNLRYDTELGVTSADSGSGPPTVTPTVGWIRTGFGSSGSGAGRANCLAWTDDRVEGTVVSLSNEWSSPFVVRTGPWNATSISCGLLFSVWCVQD